MRQVGPSSYCDWLLYGCVPSYVVTEAGIVLIDTPNLPNDALRWREHLRGYDLPLLRIVNTEPHTDHVYGNSYFPGVEVVAQVGMERRYEEGIAKMCSPERAEEMAREDPASLWLLDHPDYPPNRVRTTFEERLEFDFGSHHFECVNLPGHTAEQTAIFVAEEGVVFTGDNVFSGCKTWMQEADPWRWLDSLAAIARFDAEVVVAGHGEPRDRSYLEVQAEVIRNWIGTVESLVDAGMGEEAAMEAPVDVRGSIDPFPIGLGYHERDRRVTQINIRNLYRRILQRREALGR